MAAALPSIMTFDSNTTAVNAPAVLRTATLCVGLALGVVAFVTTFAVRAESQVPLRNAFHVRPLVGALVPTGDQRDLLKDAVLVGAQVSYAINPNVAVVSSFGWSPSEDKTSLTRPKVDLYQFDLGIEGRLSNLTPSAAISTRPYAILGGGARTYDLRNVAGASVQTNPLGYGALGLDLGATDERIGLRLEARDNVTGFKGLRGELRDRKARNDLQFAAGLTFGF